MPVTLDTDWQAYLDKLVEQGRYPSAKAALDQALTAFMHEELAFGELKAAIEEGLDESGDVEFDEALVEGIKRRGRAALSTSKLAAE
jgi:Arc/MetJ-type ribon-helix-helix transcriptional regulator